MEMKKERREVEKLLRTLVFRECRPEKTEEGWEFTVLLQGLQYKVEMTEEELKEISGCAMDILDEFEEMYRNGMTKEALQRMTEEEENTIGRKNGIAEVFVMQKIATPALNKILGRLSEIMGVGGAYDMFISRPAFLSVLYAAYFRLAGQPEDQMAYYQSLYFVLRGIMRMRSLEDEEEVAGTV